MELIKCPICGEEYSPSYRSCPFCQEEGSSSRLVKKRAPKRRLTSRRKAQSARGGMIAVLIVVLALLGWYLFGGKQPAVPDEPTPPDELPVEQTAEPPVEPPVNDDPFYEPVDGPTPSGEGDAPEPPVEQTPEPPVEPVVDVSNAALSKTDFTLGVGETYAVKLTGTTAAPTWSVDNATIATVSADGVVTAVSGGNTTLRCKAGTRELTCIVRVNGAAASGGGAASVDASALGLKSNVGALPKDPGTGYYDCTIGMSDAVTISVTGTDAAVTWTSSNTSVVTVSSGGRLTPVASGTARVTAAVGGANLTCIVRVK